MIIKPLDPITDFGASNAARRVSQRPPPPEPTQPAADSPQFGGGAALEAQAKAAEQRQQEAETQTPAHTTGPSLRFHVDQDTGKTIAELVDTEGQVVRQVPTEEALQIAKAIGKYQGMFVDLKV
jgi:flagellar protein FlaG